MDSMQGRKSRRQSTPPTEYSLRTRNAPPPEAFRMTSRDEWLRREMLGYHVPPRIFQHVEQAFVTLKHDKKSLERELKQLEGEVAFHKHESMQSIARGQKIQEYEARFNRMKRELEDKERRMNKGMQRKRAEDGKTIRELEGRVRRLRQEVEEKDEHIADLLSSMKSSGQDGDMTVELKEKIEAQDKQMLLQSELMMAGAKAIEQMRVENTRLGGVNTELLGNLQARETTIDGLNQTIVNMQNASGYEMLHLALENQASRTLGLIQGLRADIKERDDTIAEHAVQVAQCRVSIVEQEEQVIEKNAAIQELQKDVEDARCHAASAEAIAEEQQKLIDRILAN